MPSRTMRYRPPKSFDILETQPNWFSRPTPYQPRLLKSKYAPDVPSKLRLMQMHYEPASPDEKKRIKAIRREKIAAANLPERRVIMRPRAKPLHTDEALFSRKSLRSVNGVRIASNNEYFEKPARPAPDRANKYPSIRERRTMNQVPARKEPSHDEYLKFMVEVTTELIAKRIFDDRRIKKFILGYMEARGPHLSKDKLMPLITMLLQELEIATGNLLEPESDTKDEWLKNIDLSSPLEANSSEEDSLKSADIDNIIKGRYMYLVERKRKGKLKEPEIASTNKSSDDAKTHPTPSKSANVIAEIEPKISEEKSKEQILESQSPSKLSSGSSRHKTSSLSSASSSRSSISERENETSPVRLTKAAENSYDSDFAEEEVGNKPESVKSAISSEPPDPVMSGRSSSSVASKISKESKTSILDLEEATKTGSLKTNGKTVNDSANDTEDSKSLIPPDPSGNERILPLEQEAEDFHVRGDTDPKTTIIEALEDPSNRSEEAGIMDEVEVLEDEDPSTSGIEADAFSYHGKDLARKSITDIMNALSDDDESDEESLNSEEIAEMLTQTSTYLQLLQEGYMRDDTPLEAITEEDEEDLSVSLQTA